MFNLSGAQIVFPVAKARGSQERIGAINMEYNSQNSQSSQIAMNTFGSTLNKTNAGLNLSNVMFLNKPPNADEVK